MRIGFLLPSLYATTSPGNGVRVQAQRQADALAALGHEVVRLDPWESVPPEKLDVCHFFVGGFPLFTVQSLAGKAGKLAFAPIIDSNQPNWRYRIATRLGLAVPRVYTVPGEFYRQGSAADVVICRSTFEQVRVVRGLGIPVDKTAIVLNGVVPRARATPDRAFEILGSSEPFVLHVSAYTQGRKNVVRMARAVSSMGLKLVIAGTAEEGPVLDELRQVAGRHKNVHLLGYLDEATLQSFYAACRVFCLPSDHEGTGLVALEAAYQGARIVITKNGGPRDYLRSWAEYVDPYAEGEIRAAVERAWATPPDPTLQKHVSENLTWENSAKQLLAAYAGR
jgi:glycosyltransferase involved in cell wall biosynthesis